MAVFDIKFLQRLYTLAADPITMKKDSARGSSQGPTRPFVDWMDAVNSALIDILTQSTFAINDAFFEDLGLIKDANNRWQVNDLLFEGSDTIRFDTVCDVCISGLAAGRPSQQTDIINVGLGRIAIKHQSTLSADGNRINTIPAATIELAPGVGLARLYYDGVDKFWRVIIHEQGAALVPNDPPEFLATAFTARGGTWNVSAASILSYSYYLKGAMLTVFLRVLGSSASGPADELLIELPLDYVAKKHIGTAAFLRDSQGPLTGKAALLQVEDALGLSAGRSIVIAQMNGEGITGSGVVDVLGQFTMELSTSSAAVSGGTTGSNPGQFEVPGPTAVALPDQLAVIQAVAADLPVALLQADNNWEFMDEVVRRLRLIDPRFAYNGKRGDVGDVSRDAISYYWDVGDPSVGSFKVYEINVIAGLGVNAGTPVYTDVTWYDGSCTGAWVFPRGASPESNPNENVPVDDTTNPGAADAVAVGSITFNASRNPSSWAKTSNISSTRVSVSQTCITHSKRSSWTNAILNNGAVVNANAWVGVMISGVWQMSTWEFFRPGQTCKGLALGNRIVWDAHVQGPLSGNAPVQGEQVLFMMSTLARGGSPANGQERSQIVSVTWPY